jgi:hypothetical protein
MPLATFLLSMVSGLVARVLVALGMSVVTVSGLDLALGSIKASLQQAANSLPADVLSLFLISGGGSAVGIVLGAINVRITLWMVQRATSIVGRPAS